MRSPYSSVSVGLRTTAPGAAPWRTISTIDGDTLMTNTTMLTAMMTAPATIGRQPPPESALTTAATTNSSIAKTK
jgi:hypothetical protein